jgi:hypothetical protein
MFGIVLIGISQLCAEFSTDVGKYEYERKRESFYAFAFLNAFWVTVFLLVLALWRDAFVFSWESLPTFSLRAVLEIILMFVSLNAVIEADRSTFAFLRTLTIPLLLGVDIALGYAITLPQIVGVALMLGAIVLLSMNHGLSRRGKLITLFSALLPVATLSLYKFNITHFNSVEAEQVLQHVIALAAVLVIARVHTGENLLPLLFRREHLTQALSAGLASVFMSYAYLFAPASVVTAGKRAFEVIGAVLLGRRYFKEKHLALKLGAFVLVSAGVAMLVL